MNLARGGDYSWKRGMRFGGWSSRNRVSWDFSCCFIEAMLLESLGISRFSGIVGTLNLE